MTSSSQSALGAIAKICADKIATAREGAEFFDQPYKHIVIDNFLPPALAELCLNNFPSLDSPTWEHATDPDIEVKYRTTWTSEFDVPEGIIDVVRILNSSVMLQAMGNRLEIQKLVPDAYFAGGGLNATTRGGLLDVHVDGNYHDATGLNRRLNLLIYFNKDWQADWGGEFGLYDNSGQQCLKKVAPIFNRLLVFDTNDFSFHGLPNPINFPEDSPRRSIILYYYTLAPRPDAQIAVREPHSALWVRRNLLDKRGSKTRPFR